MIQTRKYLLGVGILVGVGFLLAWAFITGRKEIIREREQEKPVKTASRVVRAAGGELRVILDRETQKRIDLKIETLKAASIAGERLAYGRLEPDPSEVYAMRAPITGVLEPTKTRAWPNIGEKILDGTVIGLIQPRFTAVERVDLQSRLAAAQRDVRAFEASLAAAHAALQRARALNADDKNISDRALQEAEARAAGEEARLRASRETLQLLESSLAVNAEDASSLPLAVARGGEVTEILAQPGEAVESGQVVLRLSRYERLIARVDIPAGETVKGPVTTARILALGQEDSPLRGEQPFLASTVDPKSQGQSYLFQVHTIGLDLRPGTAVTAYLPLTGKPVQGVLIPRSALVRYGGKAWAYVQTSEEQFTRREVVSEYLREEGWLAIAGFAASDRVVVGGAQLLLSEELKSQIQIIEEEQKE